MITKMLKVFVLTVAMTSTVVTASFAFDGKDALSGVVVKSTLKATTCL